MATAPNARKVSQSVSFSQQYPLLGFPHSGLYPPACSGRPRAVLGCCLGPYGGVRLLPAPAGPIFLSLVFLRFPLGRCPAKWAWAAVEDKSPIEGYFLIRGFSSRMPQLTSPEQNHMPANALVQVTVPFLKKLPLRGHGGYISSQCRLRSTQWPPGTPMGVINSGNAPGLNSRPSACGPSVRSRRRGAFWGHSEGVPCSARGTAAIPARPMAPAVPRAPWASLPAIPVAG